MEQARGFIVGALVLAAASGASADAWVERYTRGGGVEGMGGFESTSVTVTSATAQREESTFRFTGALLSAIQRMAGSGETVRITRLDRGVVWTLDPAAKTYTEAPLSAREELERARRQGGGPPPRERGESADVVVARNELRVEKTGATRVVSGFPCEEYLLTWLVETLDRRTGETARSTMTSRIWTTPETAEIRAVQAEEATYTRAYLQRLGLGVSPAELRQFGLTALAGTTGLGEAEQRRMIERLAAELSKIQGYPLATSVAWRVEGSGAAQAPSPRGGGPAALGELLGGLGKLFGGGRPKEGAEAPREAREPGVVFTLETEVRGLRVVPPDPARFEVPAGYTRK